MIAAVSFETFQSQRCFALVLNAGSGRRVGAAVPKQYRELAGKSLVQHTLAAFLAVPRVSRVYVVVAQGDTRMIADVSYEVADCGGSTRAESVLNGLNWLLSVGINPQDWVLVHDAARCLITPQMINDLIDACLSDEVGGLLALPLPDTLKSELAGRVDGTVARERKWLAQTPQMFRVGLLRQALAQHTITHFDGVTDESSAMEAAGYQPKLVLGHARNFKVTYPEDFDMAEAILKYGKP